MTLRITSPTSPSDATYRRLLDAIPEGKQWWRGNVIPYTQLDGVPMLVEAEPGVEVLLYVAGKLTQRFFPASTVTTIHVPLEYGHNVLTLVQGLDRYQTLAIAAEYAIYLRAFADETYANLERDIEVFEQHFRSFFSVRLTEHQMLFGDMLPSSFAYRTLLAKIAARSLVNESSTTRGVDDITMAITLSNPYVEEQHASTDPMIQPVYSDSQSFGGYTFHIWSQNTCLASWYGFTRALDTLYDPDQLAVQSASDVKVTVLSEGQITDHYFDTEARPCSDIEDECADDVHIWVRFTAYYVLWLCAWARPFDTAIDLPLGRRRFDGDSPFDSGFDLDSMDATAPLDGWATTHIRYFDYPTCLDSTVGGSSAWREEDLCCAPPVDALLCETLVDFHLPPTDGIFASLVILPS